MFQKTHRPVTGYCLFINPLFNQVKASLRVKSLFQERAGQQTTLDTTQTYTYSFCETQYSAKIRDQKLP